MSPNFHLLTLLAALILIITPLANGLKCYGGQTTINQTVTTAAVECGQSSQNGYVMTATGCLKVINYYSNIVIRACDYSNCTQQTQLNCVNSTTTGQPTSTCCCMGDSCNSAYSTSFTVFGAVSVIVGSLFAL